MAASMVAAAAAAAARRPAPSPRLIRGGSISREMRNWLSQRGGWGASPGTQTQDTSLGVLYELVC